MGLFDWKENPIAFWNGKQNYTKNKEKWRWKSIQLEKIVFRGEEMIEVRGDLWMW